MNYIINNDILNQCRYPDFYLIPLITMYEEEKLKNNNNNYNNGLIENNFDDSNLRETNPKYSAPHFFNF